MATSSSSHFDSTPLAPTDSLLKAISIDTPTSSSSSSAASSSNTAATSLSSSPMNKPTFINNTNANYVNGVNGVNTYSSLPKVFLDGYSLTVDDVVAIAKGQKQAVLVEGQEGDKVRARIDESVDFLRSKLHTSLYGITTGFGGSADTRTSAPQSLQLSLLEHQLCGVVFPEPTTTLDGDGEAEGVRLVGQKGVDGAMPIEIVRGSMVVRVNSLLRGHSAVRLTVIQTLLTFLQHNITPIVPLRGSISASGDLSPLSYIAGALTAHPDVWCTIPFNGGKNGSPHLQILPSTQVFNSHSHVSLVSSLPSTPSSLEPIILGPKEGLGLVNGTAVSTAAACLAVVKTEGLLRLAEVNTGLCVEAEKGMAGSFDEFIHDVTRPHNGQVTVARNIRNLLSSSSFAIHYEPELTLEEDEGVLRQDRYPLRTSAQWLGPIWEDVKVAKDVLRVEVNSTTDNPLIDVSTSTIHHGGNFQALSPSVSSEKLRLSLTLLGKLAFSQTTELFNASMNRGLPSCLAGGEEMSTNYHVKGLDIAVAAYCSELGWLGNPVVGFVQSAEMNNQAVNSLALISARKTLESCEVMTLLLASQLYGVCQALDLRYIDESFRSQLYNNLIPESLATHFPALFSSSTEASATEKQKNAILAIRKSVAKRLDQTNSLDLEARMKDLWKHVEGEMVESISTHFDGNSQQAAQSISMFNLISWRNSQTTSSINLYRSIQSEFFSDLSKSEDLVCSKLGKGSREYYYWVRKVVGVKFRRGDVWEGKSCESVGSGVGKIVKGLEMKGVIGKELEELLKRLE